MIITVESEVQNHPDAVTPDKMQCGELYRDVTTGKLVVKRYTLPNTRTLILINDDFKVVDVDHPNWFSLRNFVRVSNEEITITIET